MYKVTIEIEDEVIDMIDEADKHIQECDIENADMKQLRITREFVSIKAGMLNKIGRQALQKIRELNKATK